MAVNDCSVRPDKEYLETAYYSKKMTYSDIAKEFGVTPSCVFYWFKKYGIKPRYTNKIMHPHVYTEEERQKRSKLHKGKIVSEESRRKISESKKIHTIGHQKKRTDGYISVYYPDHPDANEEGYIMQHRLVMEKHIGRRLQKNEVVHHKNRNRSDNRIENLELMTASEHMSFHMKERYKK